MIQKGELAPSGARRPCCKRAHLWRSGENVGDGLANRKRTGKAGALYAEQGHQPVDSMNIWAIQPKIRLSLARPMQFRSYPRIVRDQSSVWKPRPEAPDIVDELSDRGFVDGVVFGIDEGQIRSENRLPAEILSVVDSERARDWCWIDQSIKWGGASQAEVEALAQMTRGYEPGRIAYDVLGDLLRLQARGTYQGLVENSVGAGPPA